MIIRKANTSDVSKLYALEKEIFTAENFPLSRDSFYYHVKNNLLYIAEIDGNIAAYTLVLVKRRDAKLYSIGVSHSYRGKNIALKLLQTIMHELFLMGFKQILLEVRIDNKVAIALYKKLGFHINRTLKEFYLDKCNAYLMSLQII